jgi:septal ring factor EnvC (AmiA/AmiB activator)
MQLFVTAITTTVATSVPFAVSAAFLAKSESALRNEIVAGQVIANKDAEIARKDALAHREETRNLLLNSSRDTNVKMDKLSNDLDKLSNDLDKLSNDLASLTASISKKRWW